MGLLCERSPLGNKEKKRKKGERGGAMGLGPMGGGAPIPPLGRPTFLA